MSLTRQQRVRLGVIFVMVAAFFTIAAARLVQLQVLNHSDYSEAVIRQSQGKVSIPAARGLIYDRNGTAVADNIFVSSLYAYPTNRKQVGEIAGFIEDQFGLAAGTAVSKFSLAPGKFRWIKRRLSDPVADEIRSSAPQGLYLREESQRCYRFGTVGQQVLGFTDIDNVGQSGIELSSDSLLTGKKGWADVRRDGLSRTYRVRESALVAPEPGQSMVLTIDWRLQEIVEDEVRRAVIKHNAKSGQAVFVDCISGDILAMAHFDPKDEHPERPTKLRTISDVFEPGSIFKAFTAAGIIDNDHTDFVDSVDCEMGAWRMGRRLLRDDKKHGWLNFRGVMELSSNIGTAKYALRLGGENLYETARRFGIAQKQRIGMPGEAKGRMHHPERWSDYTVAALAMGHSVSVTSLQMATAFAAIANGGELLRPHLILGSVDEDGFVVDRAHREVIARCMKPSTSDSLRSILRGVVEVGTATPVKSPVVEIAGKTGTAEIPDLINKTYFKNRFNASFAGFFPYQNPLIAGIVLIEEPRPVTYGGWTSGPAFRKIAERYCILNPEIFAAPERTLAELEVNDDGTVEVPDLVGQTVASAMTCSEHHAVRLLGEDDSGFVAWQFPAPNRLLFEGDDILIATKPSDSTRGKMADLTGLTMRQALALLDYWGIDARIEGRGRVVKQSIKPGSKLEGKSVCKLKCRS